VIDIPQDAVVNAQVVRKDSDGRVIERNPAVHMCYVRSRRTRHAQATWPISTGCWLRSRLIGGFKTLQIDTYLLGQVQQILRKGDWKVTAAVS